MSREVGKCLAETRQQMSNVLRHQRDQFLAMARTSQDMAEACEAARLRIQDQIDAASKLSLARTQPRFGQAAMARAHHAGLAGVRYPEPSADRPQYEFLARLIAAELQEIEALRDDGS